MWYEVLANETYYSPYMEVFSLRQTDKIFKIPQGQIRFNNTDYTYNDLS